MVKIQPISGEIALGLWFGVYSISGYYSPMVTSCEMLLPIGEVAKLCFLESLDFHRFSLETANNI